MVVNKLRYYGSIIGYKYCILHGKMVSVESNNLCIYPFHFYEGFEENRGFGSTCDGPFAEVPPPPPLTEEDWEQIFEMRELA